MSSWDEPMFKYINRLIKEKEQASVKELVLAC